MHLLPKKALKDSRIIEEKHYFHIQVLGLHHPLLSFLNYSATFLYSNKILHNLNELSVLNAPLSGLVWPFRFYHAIFILEYSVFLFILLNFDADIP